VSSCDTDSASDVVVEPDLEMWLSAIIGLAYAAGAPEAGAEEVLQRVGVTEQRRWRLQRSAFVY
jgi:hypothetical protein